MAVPEASSAGVPILVLIVEDSEDDAVLVVRELGKGGYQPQWERVETEETMQAALVRRPWDVIIADYRMPRFTGLAALKVLQGSGRDIPFLVVSGSIGEEMAVAAMKAGVHDYIMKDNLARLVVAIERELREAEGRRLRRQAEERVRVSLREKDVLLKELHHRVKNNLQVVASLLHLGSRTIEDERTLQVFRDAHARINSIALVHEKLYQSPDFAQVELADYLREIASHAFRSYSPPATPARLTFDLEEVVTTIDAAIPCGLIVNELVSNATKYAFPDGRTGTIGLMLKQDAARRVRLTVSDTGVGFPAEVDLHHPATLGLQLIFTLCDQLQGRASFGNTNGASIAVEFSAEAPPDLRSDSIASSPVSR